MLGNKLFFIFLLSLSIINHVLSTSDKYSCSKMDPHINSIRRTQTFMPVENGGFKTLASINSVEPLKSEFQNNCQITNETDQIDDFNNKLVQLNWRVQYQKSSSCIRVELDLGKNLTKLNRNFNFNYYMFSYRKFSEANIYLNRNPINESVNTLIINKAHADPYVVCVTFFKQNFKRDPESTDASCSENKNFLLSDERIHDTDLCVDVDIYSKYLNTRVKDINHLIKEADIHPDLIMALFIIILITIILASTALVHYLIERPKQKLMLAALRNYMKSANGANVANESSSCSENDYSVKLKINDYPEDCITNNAQAESKELLAKPKGKRVNFLKPTFSIEEESEDEDVFYKPNASSDVHKKLFKLPDTNASVSEADKSVSHLLDDKPWLNN